MESLDEHNVYRVQKGRILDDSDGGLVKDVISVGLEGLADGGKNPLWEFNDAFQRLQTRRKMTPVILGTVHSASSAHSADAEQHFEDLSAAVALPDEADLHVSDSMEQEVGEDNGLTARLSGNQA
jgi:hypothetical protein